MRDARSGVVLALVALLMVGLLIALPVTMTKVLVMVGIVAGLSIVSCLRSIDWVRLTVLACFLVVLLLPMIVRTSGPPPDAGASRQVVIITPHNEQIRTEFADAFERWHLANYDEPVEVVSSSLGLQTPLLSSVEFEMQASLLKHSSVADGSHARKHERESAASQA